LPCAFFAEFNELECARHGNGVTVITQIDDSTLPCEHIVASLWCDHGPRHSGSAVNGKWRTKRVNRRGNIQASVKPAASRTFVIRAGNRVNFGKAKSAETGEYAGCYPLASGVAAPTGTATLPPAATMLPSRMTTVPPSIGALPSPTTTLPPVIAVVSAFAL
jgi:hypothetical protein